MALREVRSNGTLLARVGNIFEAPDGVTFYSKPEDILQYGACVHKAQTELKPHVHLKRARVSFHRTYEFMYVVCGRMECTLFNDVKKPVATIMLVQGDWIAMHDGGHGFKVLSDCTRFIEVKNGQFLSTEQDKERF